MELTREKLEEIFETVDSKWEGDNAFQGLEILKKYFDSVIEGAYHDIIYSVSVDEAIERGLTEEDATQLALLNWMIEEGEYFACFV